MFSTITYTRSGEKRTAEISTRRVPNFLAIQFVVVIQELGSEEVTISESDQFRLEELLLEMGIVILDVSPNLAGGK